MVITLSIFFTKSEIFDSRLSLIKSYFYDIWSKTFSAKTFEIKYYPLSDGWCRLLSKLFLEFLDILCHTTIDCESEETMSKETESTFSIVKNEVNELFFASCTVYRVTAFFIDLKWSCVGLCFGVCWSVTRSLTVSTDESKSLSSISSILISAC